VRSRYPAGSHDAGSTLLFRGWALTRRHPDRLRSESLRLSA